MAAIAGMKSVMANMRRFFRLNSEPSAIVDLEMMGVMVNGNKQKKAYLRPESNPGNRFFLLESICQKHDLSPASIVDRFHVQAKNRKPFFSKTRY